MGYTRTVTNVPQFLIFCESSYVFAPIGFLGIPSEATLFFRSILRLSHMVKKRCFLADRAIGKRVNATMSLQGPESQASSKYIVMNQSDKPHGYCRHCRKSTGALRQKLHKRSSQPRLNLGSGVLRLRRKIQEPARDRRHEGRTNLHRRPPLG
jgi:hypothetical protein